MSTDALFCSLSSMRIAEIVQSAQHTVCYAGPGIQSNVAQAMVETAAHLADHVFTMRRVLHEGQTPQPLQD